MNEELIQKIYEVMKEHVKGNNVNHYVAQDFSRSELKRFINVYFNYFMK